MKGSEKINMLLEYLSLNPSDFAKNVGLKYVQNIYDIQKDKVDISKQIAIKIATAYPSVDKNWLITGEGDMLKQPDIIQVGKQNINVSGSVSGDRNHIGVHNDGRVLQELQSENRRLTELNHKLVNDNMKLVERINFLTDKLLKS